MISNDGSDAETRPSPESLRITSDQFKALFQTLKEAPNLPDRLHRKLAERVGDVTSAVWAAREINRSLGGATIVNLLIGAPESAVEEGGPGISSSVSPLESHKEINAFVDRGLLRSWGVLVETVFEAFSERELFLRTGYSRGEVERACGWLFGWLN